MHKIVSKVKTDTSEHKHNHSQVGLLLEKLEANLSLARKPESEQARTKLTEKGKLTTHDRISQLIDPDSSLLEIAPLAGLDTYDGLPPGAGIHTCIGKVSGKPCVIIANNPSVKGGTYFPLTVKKHLRALDIALENKLPVICLVDSGGAFLPKQDEIFPDKDHFGRIFFKQAQLSKEGIPQIATVLGLCTAGGAYIPAMSEQVIMTKENSSIYLGGPQLVQAATGEIVSAQDLGGAKVHSEKSGVCDYIEASEEDAITRTRHLISLCHTARGRRELLQAQSPLDPYYDPSELYGVCGVDLKKPFPALEVIARLVDESLFDEFKTKLC